MPSTAEETRAWEHFWFCFGGCMYVFVVVVVVVAFCPFLFFHSFLFGLIGLFAFHTSPF